MSWSPETTVSWRTFRLSDKWEDTYIGGFSMGGYGALVVGLAHPEVFSRIIALSSAMNKQPFIESTNEVNWDLYSRDNYRAMFSLDDMNDFVDTEEDYEFTARRTAALGKDKMPKIFMGRGDIDMNAREADFAFRDYLIELGYDVTFIEYPSLHNYHAFNTGMEAGDAAVVPFDVPHKVVTLEDTEEIEIFNDARKDVIEKWFSGK